MQQVDDLVRDVDGRVAVYARRLDTGESFSVGAADERFPTGSAAKFLVLLAFADRVEKGLVDPATRVTMERTYRDRRLGSGVLRYLSDGLQVTLQDCATLMISSAWLISRTGRCVVVVGPRHASDSWRAISETGETGQPPQAPPCGRR